MTLLTINAGSSSVRLAAFSSAPEGVRLLTRQREEQEGSPPGAQLRRFLDEHAPGAVSIVAHRIVHGGDQLRATCVIDAAIEAEIERLAPLAPLHNPVALSWIRAGRVELPAATPVAVFDTAFFADLPAFAASYALPRELSQRLGLRRFGFQGIAHRALWLAWRKRSQPASSKGRVVSFQLGAGCSAAAIVDGRAIDTSMGFTPLEGLMMAARPGDLDPGLLLHLEQAHQLTPAELGEILNTRSGLTGVAGTGDLRQLVGSAEPAARLAVDMYGYHAKKYLGAYLAALGGAEAVLFGGGVGENQPEIRRRVVADMQWCGLELDADANARALGVAARISSASSRIEIWVLPVDEESLMAEEAVALLAPAKRGPA